MQPPVLNEQPVSNLVGDCQMKSPDLSMLASLESQTHVFSVFTRCTPDKFQECRIETGNCWKSAALSYLSDRLIGCDQHTLYTRKPFYRVYLHNPDVIPILLRFLRFFNGSLGSYNGPLDILPSKPVQTIMIPDDAGGKTIHIVLKVTDNGKPSLTSYRRIVLECRWYHRML